MSQETHAGQWLGFRQPVLRVAREKRGETVDATHEANPGEVWEETRVLGRAHLAHRSGRRARHPQATSRSPVPAGPAGDDGRVLRVDVRALGPGAAGSRGAGSSSRRSQYMRKYGVFKVSDAELQPRVEEPPPDHDALGRRLHRGRRPRCYATARPTGVMVDGAALRRLHHAVTQARVLFADAAGLGLAGTRRAALRPGPRPLARAEARGGRVRSAAELPAADAGPHPLGGQVAVRDLARQPAVDCDRRRPAATASRPATW